MIRSVVVALLLLLVSLPAQATEAGWALLRDGGRVVLMRHAMAPGTADPNSFDIENCRTQRNLSDRGRQQARRIGALFSARAAPVERVLTSRWCRALDTARLAFGDGLVDTFEPLDPAPDDEAAQAARSKAVVEEVSDFTGSGNMVMVTHQANIAALTGISAREGEAIIVAAENDGLRVLGRIIFN